MFHVRQKRNLEGAAIYIIIIYPIRIRENSGPSSPNPLFRGAVSIYCRKLRREGKLGIIFSQLTASTTLAHDEELTRNWTDIVKWLSGFPFFSPINLRRSHLTNAALPTQIYRFISGASSS